MGDPRRLRRKYETPDTPWQAERIQAEKVFVKEYGLKNKKELYRINTKLKNFTSQAKKLIASTGAQAELETQQLFAKLHKLGLLAGSTNLDDVLGLTSKDFLERRLQTVIFRKGIARTPKQARQFITHEHVVVGQKKITAPGYLVTTEDEPAIIIIEASSLASAEHPERVPIERKAKKRAPAERHRGGYRGGQRRKRQSSRSFQRGGSSR